MKVIQLYAQAAEGGGVGADHRRSTASCSVCGGAGYIIIGTFASEGGRPTKVPCSRCNASEIGAVKVDRGHGHGVDPDAGLDQGL